MDFSQRIVEKSRNYRDLCVFTDEQMGSLSREKPARQQQQQQPPEHDKRARREIANSNERRRMQSINIGFQRIKSLLPQCEDEKMSKSVILQQAVDYINWLEEEKKSISLQNEQLLQMLRAVDSDGHRIHMLKRKRRDDRATLSSDEASLSDVALPADLLGDFGRDSTSPSSSSLAAAAMVELRSLVVGLTAQLERERRLRMAVEKEVDSLKARLKLEQIAAADTTDDGTACDEKVTSPRLMDLLSEDFSSTQCPRKSQLAHDRSAVARCNLETIVKAIYHVEGDNILADKMQETSWIADSSDQPKELSTTHCHSVQPVSSSSSSLLSSSCFVVPSNSGNIVGRFGVDGNSSTTSERPVIAVTLASLRPVPLLLSS